MTQDTKENRRFKMGGYGYDVALFDPYREPEEPEPFRFDDTCPAVQELKELAFKWLKELREEGKVDMYSAAPLLMTEFDRREDEAKELLNLWFTWTCDEARENREKKKD